MVYGFIIHSLLPGTCRVLYSCVFGQESQHTDTDNWQSEGVDLHSQSTDLKGAWQSTAQPRTQRKHQFLRVSQEVQSEYNFRTAVSSRSYDQDMQNLMNEGKLPDFEIGFLHLANDEVFCEEKIAVWMGALNCGFTLICEKIENRAVAECILKLLIKNLHEHCKVLTQPTDIVLRPDRIATVLQQILPAGRLLPMNHRMVRGLEKSLEIKMKT